MTKEEKDARDPAAEARQSDAGALRRQQIAEYAYYRAWQRGCAPGGEEADWLEAEKEADARHKESGTPP